MIDPSTPFWIFLLLVFPASAGILAMVPNARASEVVARVGAVGAVVAALALLVSHGSGTFGPYLGIDTISGVFLVPVTAIYATSVWYSREYLRSVRRPFLSPPIYYALLSAFAFAMIATLVVRDLGLMWIGVEGTTVASALLLLLERRPTSVEAAWRYTLIASAGLTIALFALLLLYASTGTLDAFSLAAHPPAATLAVTMAVALALVGYGTKIGLFPMHTWLPDAHAEAPSPVSAMFSGVLLPTALYAFLRIYRILPSPTPATLSTLVLGFGVATALVAAFLLQGQRSYKRLLAYSSMEVMGLAVAGVGLGGIALYGALLLLVAHAFAKSSAFYGAGNVLQKTGTTRMADVRDLRHTMPRTAGAWVLAAAGVTGAPPFGTFVGEVLIVVGALALGNLLAAAAIVVAILLAFLGINGQIGRMVFGARAGAEAPSPGEPPTAILYLNLGVALLLGIVAIPYLTDAVRSAAVALGGGLP